MIINTGFFHHSLLMDMLISKDFLEGKIPPKVFNVHTSDPAILLQGIHFIELFPCVRMFTVALFVIRKNWNRSSGEMVT